MSFNMKKVLFASIAVIGIICGNMVYAGSPLIQTRFYTAYYLNEKVQMAEQLEFLDGTLAGFVADNNVEIGLKLAVINALQWNEKGKNSVETFKMFLGRKYGKAHDQLNLDEVNGIDLLCLGYMISLDKQRKLAEALPILEKAKNKNATSYSTQLIYSLAMAQSYVNNSKECESWKVCDNVRNNTTLVKDFEQEAIDLIFKQIDPLKDSCE
jgi:hypothetical protein